ncbi:MAG: uroporphyrinogen-III C-methyltransferase [Lentisphaerae bacterium]|nr:uroporphyrinogen-III C-methyltransferase [Lentisphaerota bacterium]
MTDPAATSPRHRLRIGTRSSRLALVQTRAALAELAALVPEIAFTEVALSSPGDRDLASDLRTSPPDFFTRDLDDALRRGDIDGAIHSAKDLPDPVPADLDWCWLPNHADGRDVLVLPPGRGVADLPSPPRIGVSSERREAYCLQRFPGAVLLPIRGTIEQRLAQLDAGQYDLVIMAAAALVRLGLQARITAYIPPSDLPPPEGQGALALTFRAGDALCLRLRSLFVKAVTFAGAGAGSVGECTLWTMRALQRADVCLYDALLDPTVLEFLPAHARRVDVGKRGGRQSPSQDAITRQLTMYARQGWRVVRLKGGDPGVFGRLAEDIDALDALQLPYRVIPGVSSINAVSTGTGMLLTRRGLSRGFTAITPRLEGGATAPVHADARARLPVVVLMGISTLPQVMRELRDEGLPPTTPAAVVFGAGTDDEEIVEGTLETLAERVSAGVCHGGEAAEARHPGTVIVGEVVRHRYRREWGALEGRRILLTSSEAIQDAAADLVNDFGGIAVQRPLIRLAPEPSAAECLQRLDTFDWITLTSPSSVRCLMALLRRTGADLRKLPKIMVAGTGTGRELARHNLQADLTPAGRFSAESLIEAARPVLRAGERILRLRSDKAGTALANALRELGAVVEDQVLYQNARIPYVRLPGFDAVFFASTSAVEAFEALWGTAVLETKLVVAIGKPTLDALRARQVPVALVGPEATVEASLAALARLCVRQRLADAGGRQA